jgi:hypothetical protein
MSTTLPHVVEDLREAEAALTVAQDAYIAALSSRAGKLTELADYERAVDEATAKRDDLRSTRDFIIQRERDRGDADANKKFSSVLYLSQRRPSFTMDDVAVMAQHSRAANEAHGITGALYVFTEWFASYLEGSQRTVEKLLRNVQNDPRHRLFRIVATDLSPDPMKRLLPKESLRVKYCLDSPDTGAPAWTAIVRYLQTQADFANFEPRPAVVAKGVGARSGRWFLLRVSGAHRYAAHLDRVEPSTAVKSLAAVRDATKQVIERLPGASVLTPFGSQGCLCVMPAGGGADGALVAALALREAIVAAEPACFPHMALLMSKDPADAVYVSDGRVSVVGPALRRLRILHQIAVQDDRSLLIDSVASQELSDRSVTNSFGWFEFDGEPTEVFVPSHLTGDTPLATWALYIDHQLRARAKAKRRTSVAGGSSAAARSMNSWGASDALAPSASKSIPSCGGSEYGYDRTRINSAVDPDSIMTAEKFAHLPVVGGVTEAEARAEFDKLHPRESDDTITIAQLQTTIYDIDFMGAPPPIAELRLALKELGAPVGADPDPENERVT